MAERFERLRESTSEAGFPPIAQKLERGAERFCDLQGVATNALTDVGGVSRALVSEPELDSHEGHASTPAGVSELVLDWIEEDRDQLAELIAEPLHWNPQTREVLVALDASIGEVAGWF
ncbi:MAG: hypothetical protein GY898_22285 [Proteobacteria bacterium]|nr:hypothetical protein [Pseudomonadota bacterium]